MAHSCAARLSSTASIVVPEFRAESRVPSSDERRCPHLRLAVSTSQTHIFISCHIRVSIYVLHIRSIIDLKDGAGAYVISESFCIGICLLVLHYSITLDHHDVSLIAYNRGLWIHWRDNPLLLPKAQEQWSKQLEIAALVRSEAQASMVQRLGVKPVMFSSFDETDLLEKIAQGFDVVVHAGAGWHTPSAKALITGQGTRKTNTNRPRPRA
ncbi:uncharacterized protein BO95DRAFT_463310 [Aspergillus brunneoviolaceus CBS 621.78]|uniref:Uncharacterized protein n=1 Tax=Aspergillus brunneoviolaceus CBS 621.78 TaxID=1450534 RepID=A0ACD1GAF4_9EURO|nr:hypothetical protein BO95DRAFT_463310 [Aspergillus brunneoviolaceus CBS 621.78]RAH46256.1 hypothetical protein BO95DRAFT_463310 [Aspergillus brunneoviolaceus CBS 621.78]